MKTSSPPPARRSSRVKAHAEAVAIAAAAATEAAASMVIDEEPAPERKAKRKSTASIETKPSPAKRTKRSVTNTKKKTTSTANPFLSLSEEVLLRVVSFASAGDVAQLTSSCKALHDGLSNSFWGQVMDSWKNIAKPTAGTSSKKPATSSRDKVLKFASEKCCRHCKVTRPNITKVRKHNQWKGMALCAACHDLPRFQEIGFKEAMREYHLKHYQLAELPYRTIQVSRPWEYSSEWDTYPKKMLNLQAVLDVVSGKNCVVQSAAAPAKAAKTTKTTKATKMKKNQCHGCKKVNPSFTPVRLSGDPTRRWLCADCFPSHPIQEIGYMQAMRDFDLKRVELLQLPCRTIQVPFPNREVPKKLYNLQIVMDYVEKRG